MRYFIIFLGAVGGCMLSKQEHEKIPQNFFEQEEPTLTEQEKEIILTPDEC